MPASADVGSIVIVTTSVLPDATGGDALLSNPVPTVLPLIELSRMTVLQPGAPPSDGARLGVVVVAVTLGKGAIAGKTVAAVAPDWKPNWIDAVLGTVACQSNSPHRTTLPEGQDAVNVCVNVPG